MYRRVRAIINEAVRLELVAAEEMRQVERSTADLAAAVDRAAKARAAADHLTAYLRYAASIGIVDDELTAYLGRQLPAQTQPTP